MPDPFVLFIFLCAIVFSNSAPAMARDFTQLNYCLGDTLAQKTGRSACWAKWEIDRKTWLCVPKTEWITWLNAPEITCRNWIGKWKLSAPMINDVGSTVKPTFRIFKSTLSEAPDSPSHLFFRSALRMATARWERVRERAANSIRDQDSTGALRQLLTGEKTTGGGCELLRRLGFLHLLTASGIHLYALARWIDILSRYTLKACNVPVVLALRVSRVLSAATWLFGWLLGGARIGMFRPWLLVSLQRTARLSGFRWRKWVPLTLTLLIDFSVGWIRGNDALSGRWIYFLAVAGSTLPKYDTPIGHFTLAFSSWIFVALWESYHDHLVSLAAPLINLISASLLSGVLYPILLFCTVLDQLGLSSLSTPLAQQTANLGSLLIESVAFLALKFRGLWTVNSISTLSGIFVSSLVIGVPLGFSSKQIRRNALIAAVALVSVRFTSHFSKQLVPFWPQQSNVALQLDGGQGDSARVYWGEPPHRISGL
ncbi:MAG: hypothetical protein AABZ55_11725, partial [Bdellovibrionota bacterium]